MENIRPRLNFDVLLYVCSFLTNVSDALSFSLTCSALRKDALQHRLKMSPVVLSDCDSVENFHKFIFADSDSRAPHIYGLKLLDFHYNFENEEARRRSEATNDHLVTLLESATHLQSLEISTSVGDRVLTAAAKVPTLRELFVLCKTYHVVILHQFLPNLWCPLRCLHIEAFDSEHFDAGFLHYYLAHLSPTLETLEVDEFPLCLSPSSVATPFTALRTLKAKSMSIFNQLDLLLWLFPNLDTLIVDRLDGRLIEDECQELRGRNKAVQMTRSWPSLEYVVCEADLAFLLAIVCPVRRMDLTVLPDKHLRYLAETLRHNCPQQLRLSLSLEYGLYPLNRLCPSGMEDKPTHLVMFIDIDNDVQARRFDIPWTRFIDKLIDSMSHLRLTHLRIVFHYKFYLSMSNAASPDIALLNEESPANVPRETDLHLAATRFFNAIPTLKHVFLTSCGRTWVYVGSYAQLRSKWSSSKAWRAIRGEDGSGLNGDLCMEIGSAEAETVMGREDLQLSRREEDVVRPCGDSPSK